MTEKTAPLMGYFLYRVSHTVPVQSQSQPEQLCKYVPVPVGPVLGLKDADTLSPLIHYSTPIPIPIPIPYISHTFQDTDTTCSSTAYRLPSDKGPYVHSHDRTSRAPSMLAGKYHTLQEQPRRAPHRHCASRFTSHVLNHLPRLGHASSFFLPP